jgi:hypothetical protein
MNKLSTVAVLSLAVLLTGYDSEPSSSEIQKAMQDGFDPIYPDVFALMIVITSCVYIPVVSDVPVHYADDVRCNG